MPSFSISSPPAKAAPNALAGRFSQRVVYTPESVPTRVVVDLDDGQVDIEDAPPLCRGLRRQPSSDAEVGGRVVEHAVEDVVNRQRSRQISVAQRGIGRERPEQRVQGLAAAVHGERQVVVNQEARCRRPGIRCLVVADCVDDVALPFVPRSRRAVQRRDHLGRPVPQFATQQIGEQVVW